MLGFIKRYFFAGLAFLLTLTGANSLSCISMKNQECKVRPKIVNVNGDNYEFFRNSIKTSKCSGICININNPYAKIYVPDVVKNLNVKVFNLTSRTNETRHIEQHETYKCECRLNISVCNNKHRWNHDKCRRECEELIDKGVCDKGFIWNPSNCECECDKSCDFSEYLDYKNCKCKKMLLDKLVEEYTENIEETRLVEKTSTELQSAKNENKLKCSSCTLCIVLFSILLTINVGISTYFVYFYWYIRKGFTRFEFGTVFRQKFNEYNSIELVNGKSETNKY